MIKPLTSLRFVFALMVFLSHLDWMPESEKLFYKLFDNIFSKGYIGVSFFFVLSGFILTLNYKKRLLKKKISFKKFWIGRIARIYPLHLFTLLLSMPVFFTEIFDAPLAWIARFLSNLFLVQSFVPAEVVYFGFNAVSWSISNEIFYYLLFPGFLLLLYRKRTLVYYFIALVLLLLGVMVISPEEQHIFLFAINPLFRISDFIIGILLYRLYEKNIFTRFFSTLKSATLFEVGAIFLFALFFLFHRRIPVGLRITLYYWIPMMAIILVFAYQKGLISRLLSHPKLILLGEISFSFYMLHGLIMRYILALDRRIHLIENVYALMGICFVAVLIASYYSYKYLEIPCNLYLRKKLNRKTPVLQPVLVDPEPDEEIK